MRVWLLWVGSFRDFWRLVGEGEAWIGIAFLRSVVCNISVCMSKSGGALAYLCNFYNIVLVSCLLFLKL